MATAKTEYLGSLRTKNTHLKSGDTFITDAPTDNYGKGEAFSPTDTVATGLANCMLTIMGIKAENQGIDMKGTTAEVTKTMAPNPRRISKIEVDVRLPSEYDAKTRMTLEHAAKHCPVHHSLHPDIELQIEFHYPNK